MAWFLVILALRIIFPNRGPLVLPEFWGGGSDQGITGSLFVPPHVQKAPAGVTLQYQRLK